MTVIAGLTSGEGDALFDLLDRIESGTLDAELAGVVGDGDVEALETARERGIEAEAVPKNGDSKEEHERRIADVIDGWDADVIALDGYMPILSPYFTERYEGQILSSHPSLLPAFNTTQPWKDALEAGVEVTGVTVHFVTDEIGEGQILTQEPVRVRPADDPESLRRRLEDAERRAYPRAIRLFDDVEFEDGKVVRPNESDSESGFGDTMLKSWEKESDLRYGENPHQDAAFYRDTAFEGASVGNARQLGGKEMSYNNMNDTDAALSLVREFDRPAAVVVKHTNPCGTAVADTVSEAYDRALATDEMSAFGGIVALNRECDADTAEAITESFKEVVVAPSYTDDALEELRTKESLRILEAGELGRKRDDLDVKKVEGGVLVQDRDDRTATRNDLDIPTEREPTDDEIEAMLFGYTVVKHVKSNAIVLADNNDSVSETVGVGAGQMSRVDAVRIARDKAEKPVEGSILASDAFFPFRDNIDEAAEAGVEAIIQPGGSVNDDEVIEACDEHGIAMALTGFRCFRH
ncbi:bifunctional phosphoribosylaminoimidazolecarboxamide formyltransferase/IMP cyclohydrolase [Halorutilales archaeon Cl-col2-1]